MSKPLFDVTVTDEGAGVHEYRFRVMLDACDDYIPLESQATREDADGMADDARILIGALVAAAKREERERIASSLLEHAHHIKDSCDVCAIVNDIRAGAYGT